MNRWAWTGVTVVALMALLIWAFAERHRLLEAMTPEVRGAVEGAWRGFKIERDKPIVMTDGTALAVDVYRPRRSSSSRLPAILVRLPYDKKIYDEALGIAMFFAARDFVVVLQDMRGRFRSEGEYVPNKDDAEDGNATVDWIARQPWSNGRIGTMGCSALGESQVLLATQRNPAHSAMIAQGAGGILGSAGGRYTFGFYEGGILNLASTFGWFLANGSKTPGHAGHSPIVFDEALKQLPVLGMVSRYRKDPTDFDDFASKPPNDPYWQSLGYVNDTDRFDTPALMINTWQDQTVADTLVLSELMKRNAVSERAATHHHVIIAPGNHCDYQYLADKGHVGEQPVGTAARQPYWEWYLAWFNHWLRDETAPLPSLPAYLLYVMAEDVWIKSPSWPPPGVVEQRWYLDDGSLVEVPPSSGGTADSFTYDPMDPTPTRGGPICCTGERAPSGPVNQREVEQRADVLVYSSAILPHGLRIAGPLTADLYVSSDALDTDFMAKLVDVWPDGTALNVQEGALRMRYREGYSGPSLLDPGKVYRVSIDLRAIAHYFKPGHRIRLQVSSSNFPRLERNLNTGGPNFSETTSVKALNRVFRGGDTPSSIVLPVLPSLEGMQ